MDRERERERDVDYWTIVNIKKFKAREKNIIFPNKKVSVNVGTKL